MTCHAKSQKNPLDGPLLLDKEWVLVIAVVLTLLALTAVYFMYWR